MTIRGPKTGKTPVVDGRCREAFTILVLAGPVKLTRFGATGASDNVAGQYGGAEINFIDGGRGQAHHMRLRASCDGTQYGINVFDTGDVTIGDSVLSGYLDAAVYVGGIRDPSDSVTVRRNVTRGNNYGILIEDSLIDTELAIIRNETPRNTAGLSSAGIYIRNSDGVVIERNSSAANGVSGIWLDQNSDFNALFDNTALANGVADLRNDGDDNCGSGNTFESQSGAPLAQCQPAFAQTG